MPGLTTQGLESPDHFNRLHTARTVIVRAFSYVPGVEMSAYHNDLFRICRSCYFPDPVVRTSGALHPAIRVQLRFYGGSGTSRGQFVRREVTDRHRRNMRHPIIITAGAGMTKRELIC